MTGISDCDFVTIAYATVHPISIDIKPANSANRINPRSRGVIPVALLGSSEFDVRSVDRTSVRFGPDAAPPTGNDHLRDMNLDGYEDLVVTFRARETGIQCGDTDAGLTAATRAGRPIEGRDAIETVGCPHAQAPRSYSVRGQAFRRGPVESGGGAREN